MSTDILSSQELQALKIIRSHIAHHGVSPSVRFLMNKMGYKSPRSASLVLDKLMSKGFISKNNKGIKIKKEIPKNKESINTIEIPLVGSAPCGNPILAEENIEMYIPVSMRIIKSKSKYFFLRAIGDSMNKNGINDGDLVLFKQQSTAENGQVVVAIINGEATIKEFHRTKENIVLTPRSNNKKHKPIILFGEDLLIQGAFIQSISLNKICALQ